MSKLNSLYVSLLALVVAFVALGMSIHYGAQKKDVNVEETLNNNPEIILNAMQSYEQKLREQAAAEAQKLIEANLPALNNDANTPFIGAADAPVVLVEFFDFSCHYCHKVYPAIKQIAEANPDIKIVFKPLTFVAPISKYAAKAALAANEQGKFFDVYNAIFSFEGRPDEAKIDELVASTGVDMEKLKADMNSSKVNGALNGISDLAGKIQVNGVPALFLNGKQLQTIDGAEIQRQIDSAK